MRRGIRSVAISFALVVLGGCSTIHDAACALRQSVDVQATPDETSGANGSSASGAPFTIAFLGDSLTAGLGLRSEDAYPMIVQKKFAAEGYQNVEIGNDAVTGETTAGGVRRLQEVLQPDLRILVLALGSNDAIRGLAIAQTRENLTTIIEAARARGAAVLLAGVEPPTDLGQDYQQAFRGIFVQLARDYKENIYYMPSLLEGVAGNPALNQADGLRPNSEGAKVIAENVFVKLRIIVDAMGGGG